MSNIINNISSGNIETSGSIGLIATQTNILPLAGITSLTLNHGACSEPIDIENASNLIALNLPYLTSLTGGTFTIYNCSALTSISIPLLTDLYANYPINIHGNSALTTITCSSAINLDAASNKTAVFINNALHQSTIDNLLVAFANGNTTNGVFTSNGGTNATPSVTGLTAKATLIGRGWTVTTN